MDFCDLQAALLVRRNQKKARDFYAADEIWNKASMRPQYLAGQHTRRYVEASGHCQTFK